MKIPLLLPVMFCFSGFTSGADLPAPEVRPIREIQTAATVEPFAESQVSAQGVVTWVDGAEGHGFYIQDPSGGLLVTQERGPGPKVAERVRVAVEQTAFEFDGQTIPVTISVGVATRKPDETIWENFFKRGDTALYQSKQNGRNRVTISP